MIINPNFVGLDYLIRFRHRLMIIVTYFDVLKPSRFIGSFKRLRSTNHWPTYFVQKY
jgi:hypothetical protein